MIHNLKHEASAPYFIKERNNRIKEAYQFTLVTIDRIQGFLDDEYLRGRIESDMTKKEGVKSTILQCSTPFCIISLGCDEMGRYNLVYSLDYRIQEMIGNEMASGLIRRIYQFTPGDMEPFVLIGSLYHDCIESYDQVNLEMQTEKLHIFHLKEKNN
jgi:hypothetical protein